jgi:hypothetical protein
MTTDGRIGANGRLDRTQGSYRLYISPFGTEFELASRLGDVRGGKWQIETNHVGGHGEVTQAIEQTTREAVNLWRDARGRWYITKQIGQHGWLPDLDATEALGYEYHVNPTSQDSVSFPDFEAHPEW